MVKTFLTLLCSACALVHCRPQGTTTFVATTVSPSTTTPTSPTTSRIIYDTFEDLNGKEGEEEVVPKDDNLTPIITEFKVRSDIQFRYSRSLVESYVKNPSTTAKEISFSMVMPTKAFVSNFSMTIDNQEFVAKVQGKKEANETYNKAVGAGQSAGIVQQDVREANKIVISTNLEPQQKVRFFLTYEELLQRKLGQYEHIIHVNPGQVVNNFVIDVFINESLPISNIKVPELKTNPNDITSSNENQNALVEKNENDTTKVHVQYKPSTELQKKESKSGLAGQFIIQYDVDRKNQSSDVQVIDGYFVHFFTPDKLETLPKHVIFVIDLSGSMTGEKLVQTKDAMVTIIDDLTEKDHFNILTFSDDVYHWNSENEKLLEGPHSLTYPGTEELRTEALSYVLGLETIGGTNINSALLEGLKKAKEVKIAEILDENVKPIIIFLTDGEATSGVRDSAQIIKNMNTANEFDIPIYGLAFGRGADFGLIKKISEETNALARKIYEGSDASIQLEDFYLEIASPLLSNVKFDYVGEAVQNGSVTKTSLGTYNKGGEFVIAGKIKNPTADEPVKIEVSGSGASGPFKRVIDICFRPLPIPMPIVDDALKTENSPVIDETPNSKLIIDPWFPCFPIPPRPEEPLEPRSEAQNFLERLWAFTTINDLIEQSLEEKEKENEIETEDEIGKNDVSKLDNDSDVEDKDDSEEDDEDDSEEEDKVKDVIDEAPSLTTGNKNEIIVKEESAKEKALRLALKYNFVTSITSLVVTRPNENETVPIDLEPAKSASSGGHQSGFRSGGGFPLRRFSSTRFKSPPRNAMQGPPGFQGRPGPIAMAGPQFMAPTMMMDYDYDDQSFASTTTRRYTTTTTIPKTSCSGSLKMFEKTLLRGNPVEVKEDELDLTNLDISKKLTSLSVEGDCCWEIYGEQGQKLVFSEGEYKSATSLKFLFRKAFSVKKLFQC